MSDPNLFAQWLRDRRKALRLTQTELAARTGLSFSAVQKLEGGQRRPSRQVAELLVEALRVPHKERARFMRLALDPTASEGGEPMQTLPPNNLPAQLTDLIGRADVLESVTALLKSADVRLLTLTGPPGIGKTRLAIQAASHLLPAYSDGVFFVTLAPVRDPARVISNIAGALSVREKSTEPISLTLKDYLREQQVLLVLDNFEQVVEAAPAVADLLWGCPDIKILVTSREALHVRGERRYQVPSLDKEAAVQLFVERARQVVAEFSLTRENEAAVAEICSRMEGVPLAIELVAARARLLPPKSLLERLVRHGAESTSGMLPLLVGGQRDLPERHRTLRSAIEWSHDLLNAEQRALFAKLGVFVGGFTLSSVEAVCNAAQDLSVPTLDSLESLFDKGLLKLENGTGGEGDKESRYTMLETIREYAAERLEERGEAGKVKAWHAEYYLALAQAAKLQVHSEQQQLWGAKLDAEHDNIQVALRWAIDTGKIDLAAQIAAALGRFWYIRGNISEGSAWLEELAKREESGMLHAKLQAELLSVAGLLALMQFRMEQASRHLERSLPLARQAGDQALATFILGNMGSMELLRGNYARAEGILREALTAARAQGNKRTAGVMLHNLALISLYRGDFGQVQTLEEESIPLFREAGDKWNIGLALTILGLALIRSGHPDEAESVADEAITIIEGTASNADVLGLALTCKAEVAKSRGDHGLAGTLYYESLRIESKMGSYPPIAQNLLGLGLLAASDKEATRATTLFGALDGLSERLQAEFVKPADRPQYERDLAAMRTLLGGRRWTLAWERGRTMSVDEAVAFALRSSEDER